MVKVPLPLALIGLLVFSPCRVWAQELTTAEQGYIDSIDQELDFRPEQIPAIVSTGWEYCRARQRGLTDDEFRELKVALLVDRDELPLHRQLGIAKMVNLIVARGRRYLCPEPILEGEQTYYHPLVHVVWEFNPMTTPVTCTIINITDQPLHTVNVYFNFYTQEGDQADQRLAAAYDLEPKASETIWVQSPQQGIVEVRIDRLGGF